MADGRTSDRYPWMDFAACAETDPDAYSPQKGGSVRDAKRICLEVCTVRASCLRYAIDNGISEGVYGGLSPTERRKLKRENAANL